LVAERPKALKPYGLDRPEARWRVFAGGKEVLSLLVGSLQKGKGARGTRAYAKLSAGDLVFLLDAQLTAKALGEDRKRNVWAPPPDAAQVETLRYGYARTPFTLRKAGGRWQADKGGGKVSTAAVQDTLDALAGLQAERYVADRGADLKLYGLQPPQLVLEAQTPARHGPLPPAPP